MLDKIFQTQCSMQKAEYTAASNTKQYSTIIEVDSRLPWPSNALSNFAAYEFVYKGILFASLEGFLQGLKCEDPEEQLNIFYMSGIQAKRAGQKHNKKSDTLWFQGKRFSRYSEFYQNLLKDVYLACAFQNYDYRNALCFTAGSGFKHTVGKKDPSDTILTEQEFVSLLEYVRSLILGQ